MGETITSNGVGLLEEAKAFWAEEDGIGVVELILILVGICRPPQRCILCGNFYSRF